MFAKLAILSLAAGVSARIGLAPVEWAMAGTYGSSAEVPEGTKVKFCYKAGFAEPCVETKIYTQTCYGFYADASNGIAAIAPGADIDCTLFAVTQGQSGCNASQESVLVTSSVDNLASIGWDKKAAFIQCHKAA